MLVKYSLESLLTQEKTKYKDISVFRQTKPDWSTQFICKTCVQGLLQKSCVMFLFTEDLSEKSLSRVECHYFILIHDRLHFATSIRTKPALHIEQKTAKCEKWNLTPGMKRMFASIHYQSVGSAVLVFCFICVNCCSIQAFDMHCSLEMKLHTVITVY